VVEKADREHDVQQVEGTDRERFDAEEPDEGPRAGLPGDGFHRAARLFECGAAAYGRRSRDAADEERRARRDGRHDRKHRSCAAYRQQDPGKSGSTEHAHALDPS
jgi:hypothetical protein